MPPGAVEGPGYPTFALDFARIAQVDEHHAVFPMQGQRLFDGHGLDLGLRLGQQRLVALLHRRPPCSWSVLHGFVSAAALCTARGWWDIVLNPTRPGPPVEAALRGWHRVA